MVDAGEQSPKIGEKGPKMRKTAFLVPTESREPSNLKTAYCRSRRSSQFIACSSLLPDQASSPAMDTSTHTMP